MAEKLKHRRRVMKRVTVILTVLALVLAGATVVLAQDVPQALKGVNLSTAQALTPAQAQQIRGTASPRNSMGLNTTLYILSEYHEFGHPGVGPANGSGVNFHLQDSGTPPYPPYFTPPGSAAFF
jgi:hypothetical protein